MQKSQKKVKTKAPQNQLVLGQRGLKTKTMQDNQLTWKYRFSRMKRHYNFSYEKMASLIGVKPNSIRVIATLPDDKFPNAWKLSIIVFEIEQGIFNVDEASLPMNQNPYLDEI